jgi:hypothetical protein
MDSDRDPMDSDSQSARADAAKLANESKRDLADASVSVRNRYSVFSMRAAEVSDDGAKSGSPPGE